MYRSFKWGVAVGFSSLLGILLPGCGNTDSASRSGEDSPRSVELLNLSYDPTRELYKEYNEAFAKHWRQTADQTVRIKMSPGGSGGQLPRIHARFQHLI